MEDEDYRRQEHGGKAERGSGQDKTLCKEKMEEQKKTKFKEA